MVARLSPKQQAGVRLPPPMPRSIAQPGSALALGARGRRFESYYSDQVRRVGRVVDCTGLENQRTERFREFESHTLRQH